MLPCPSLPPPSCVTWGQCLHLSGLSFLIFKTMQHFLPCAAFGRIRKEGPWRADREGWCMAGTPETGVTVTGLSTEGICSQARPKARPDV